MSRPPHVCPNKGCRGYALGSDDEKEGAQHHRRNGGDGALDVARKAASLGIRSSACVNVHTTDDYPTDATTSATALLCGYDHAQDGAFRPSCRFGEVL